jgi:hypothetical protein
MKIIKNSCGKKGCTITRRVLPQGVLKVIYKKLAEEIKKAA